MESRLHTRDRKEDDMAAEQIQSDALTGVVPTDILASMSGLDILRQIADGRLPGPPIGELLGFRPIEVESGRVVFAATPDARHYNPIGSVHGGYVATLLDSCMSCAVHSMLEAGEGYTTVEFKVNLVRPISVDTGEVRAEGRIIHRGRQIGTAEGRLTDAKGRLLAHGTATCLVIRLSQAAQAPAVPA
jgi:uncharacterized protein (TIGR00369 family)